MQAVLHDPPTNLKWPVRMIKENHAQIPEIVIYHATSHIYMVS